MAGSVSSSGRSSNSGIVNGWCSATYRLLLGVPGEEREADDPRVVERLRVVELELGRQADPQARERQAGDGLGVGDDQDQVAGLGGEPLAELGLDVAREELGGRAGQRLGLDLEPDQALGAEGRRTRSGRRGPCGCTARRPRARRCPRIRWPASMRLLEDLELGLRGDVGDVLELEAVAQVGPVAAEPLHRRRDTRAGATGASSSSPLNSLAMAATRISIVGHDVVVVDERHLDVELGELRLPVGAEVLVAEAAGDLEIAVEARDHQELLVELGRLGQGVEMAGVNAGWGPGSRGPLRACCGPGSGVSTSRKPRSDIVCRMSCASRWRRMKIFCMAGRRRSRIAVRQAQLLVGLGPVHLERGRRGGVVDHQLAGADLDRAGLELGVLLAGQPRAPRSP